MRIVQKYGGTSLADTQCLQTAARRVCELVKHDIQVIVVVSAQGHTTDALVEKAAALSGADYPREMDALLSTGEQMSAALMAMTINTMGVRAISLRSEQAGILTDDHFGDAAILQIVPDRIEQELAKGYVVVVAGFQGISRNGDVTTLGRGGSDTTAVALAAALQADRCQIYTDVDGVYDRDPRLFSDAVRYDYLGYEDTLRLVDAGAQVLHRKCVELARENGILLEVLSSFASGPGTIVGNLELF